ncbi:MAG: DUF4091 domain-containing protein [Verrucomicrobiae bacterium]|nr:DUF4091 domain-containing protein [Verrucomicrobiae bacterium]
MLSESLRWMGMCALGFAAVVAQAAVLGSANYNLLPNGDFEEGQGTPAGWTWAGEVRGDWVSQGAPSGQRAISIQGEGKGAGYWRSSRLKLTPGAVYRFSFWAKRETNASGGCLISGPSLVNRDIIPDTTWQRYQSLVAVPVQGTNDYLRLGHWEGRGTAYFDNARLVPIWPVHAVFNHGLELGKDESVEGGVYHCRLHFAGEEANYSRVLHEHRCGFNTSRWSFGPGAYVIYRHRVPGGFRTAQLKVNVNYYVGGRLQVEASADGSHWQTVGVLEGERRAGEWAIPAGALEGGSLWVRLVGEGANCNLQVNQYELAASLRQPMPEARGMTYYVEPAEPPLAGLQVQFPGVEMMSGSPVLVMQLMNESSQGMNLKLGVGGPEGREELRNLPGLAAGATQTVRVPLRAQQPGQNTVNLALTDARQRRWLAAAVDFQVGVLADPRPGYWLAESSSLGLWWCESGWKIGRERALPARPAGGKVTPITVAAARGEYEAAQLVLRPAVAAELRSVQVGPLRNARGQLLKARCEWMEVAYVKVTRPTDNTCEPGWYPDPLPPLRLPLRLTPQQNQPLWLQVYVEPEAQAGEYQGEITLATSAGNWRVPLRVMVYGFQMPVETHLRSAFGLSSSTINRYHHLTNAEQRALVYQMYLTNFARHRIAPYSFFAYSPIQVRFTGTGADKRAEVDFTAFEKAARQWLDEQHFNSFLLPLRGMGGGTFHSRHLGELEGFKEGTPEHSRLFKDYLGQVERYLRERGWLSKAYTYWFDEPDPKDYEFVAEGMKRIKAAAPGLKRMLTEQPEPELLGHVDIWCGLTPEWTPEKVAARRAAGEEVWWYICCAPHAPYITEFIDHPGLELRLWPWQSWQYGVQGILVWETVWWTSSAAFPGAQRQNPWEDAMSYVAGYDYKPGQIGYWGNGDGRFLYPPRSAMAEEQPCLEPPVTSLRWENLRDGMEDYEYFWMLQQRVEREKRRGAPAARWREAEALLRVPENISRDTRNFTTDPRLVLAHREKLARMIEKLGD